MNDEIRKLYDDYGDQIVAHILRLAEERAYVAGWLRSRKQARILNGSHEDIVGNENIAREQYQEWVNDSGKTDDPYGYGSD